MNYYTSTTNGQQQPPFRSAFEGSGGLNGSAGDATSMDAFERLFNLNNTNGTHQHGQGQDHSQFTTTSNNNTLDASLFAGSNNGHNEGASAFGRGFNGVNGEQQQANLFSQILMAKTNGYTNNNDAFGSSQLGGNQGINNNDGMFLTQQDFLNAASNAGATGGTQSLMGLPQAMSTTPAPASSRNNNNTDNFMINAQQAQQLLLMGQLGQQQPNQQQAASIPHQQLMALLAGMNNSQVGGSNFNGHNNAFTHGSMAAPTATTMQQLLLHQQQQQLLQQQLQCGNILLPPQTVTPLDYNHQIGNSFHEFLGNVAPGNAVPSIKPLPAPPAPPAQAPLRALSAYNFYFRYQRERILNGEDTDNDNDDRDTHWSKERQDALLQEHWRRDRTVKRRHRKSHGKISFADLSKKISQSWKVLPEQRKDFFREVAGKDWARYHRELTQHKLDLTSAAEQSAAATIHPLMGL